MPLPFPPNNTCDIYHTGNSPPAAPDQQTVRCHLTGDYERRLETGEGETRTLRYTHVLLVASETDVRDNFNRFAQNGSEDSVYVPDQNGTQFKVVLVETQHLNLPTQHKKVYLDRYLPTWPTNDL